MAGVRGVVREARNERRVLVPRETLASKVCAAKGVSYPGRGALKQESKNSRETYSTSFIIAYLGGAAHIPPPPLSCFEHQINISGGSKVATSSVDVWLDRRKDVSLF